jgi:hypothetical protein
MRVTNGIPLESSLFLPVDTVNFVAPLKAMIGEETPVMLVANKLDLLPSDTKRNQQRLIEWLHSEASAAGLLNIEKVVLVSANTSWGLRALLRRIAEACTRQRRDAYLIGATNVGKSSLVNRLLEAGGGPAITTSPTPGTTISNLEFSVTVSRGSVVVARAADGGGGMPPDNRQGKKSKKTKRKRRARGDESSVFGGGVADIDEDDDSSNTSGNSQWNKKWRDKVKGAARGFEHDFALKDVIGSYACVLDDASRRATIGIPLGCSLLLPVGTVNSVQTLKASLS